MGKGEQALDVIMKSIQTFLVAIREYYFQGDEAEEVIRVIYEKWHTGNRTVSEAISRYEITFYRLGALV
jgi:hypothetical protein